MKNRSSMGQALRRTRFMAFAVALAVASAMCIAPASAFAAGASESDAAGLTVSQKTPAVTSTYAKAKATAKKKASKKAKVHYIKTAKQWRDISKYKGGTFKLAKNIKLPSEKYYLTITKNKKYTIDLNGHTVKTAYTGVPLRTVAPLYVTKGTVIIKTSNKKGKGVLYSTETAAIVAEGSSKVYIKSGSIVDNATEFRSDITSAIMLYGKAKCYLQGKSKVQSIGNGIALFGSARLYATGNPYVRAGANNYKGQFTHYGNGLVIASRNARVVLKGGSYGTKASPDVTLWSPAGTMTYAQSANYPILDQFGYALDPSSTLKTAIPSGYKVVNAKNEVVNIRGANLSDYYDGVNNPSWDDLLASMGYKTEKRYTTTVTDINGFYTVYIKK